MNNIIKYLIVALIIIVVFSSLIFTGTLELLGLTINESKEGIEFIPLELRVILFLIIIALMFGIGKSFFK